MFSIIHGNRIEALAEQLLADPARRDTDVLRPETLIVPNLGMARWLKDRNALRMGYVRTSSPYLGEFIWKSFSALLPDVPARSPFDPEVIAWRVFERLGALPEVPEYGPLAAYVTHGDPEGRMRLASRIARLFDQYPRVPARLAVRLGKGPAARARQRDMPRGATPSTPGPHCDAGLDQLEREGHRVMGVLLHRCTLFRGHVEGQIDRMADVARAHAVERDAGHVGQRLRIQIG